MNFTDLLGTLAKAGMSQSANKRMRGSMGGGNGSLIDVLGGMLGGAQSQGSQGGGVLGQVLEQLTKAQAPARSGARQGGGLGQVLEQLGRSVGNNRTLATGGLGSLAGAIFGGGSKSMRGAVGGGLLALLGTLAMQALQNAGQKPQAPMGLVEPQNEAEVQEVENQARIIVEAMINAAKADGQISQDEVQRIAGRLQESEADEETLQFVLAEMQKPMQTQALIAAVGGRQELAAEVYAASLLAIEVDTPQERQYLDQLGLALGLEPAVTRHLEEVFEVA
ncbi:MAG: tellurite resistance TerB family protein [Desulfobulbaceae bacterium]|nr:tellurite resistance TerB family protein [Desulfobulbaceae bacterium]